MDREEYKSKLIDQHQPSPKKHKPNPIDEVTIEFREKIHNLLSNQQETRKLHIDNLMRSMGKLVQQINKDYKAMEENQLKLQHLTESYMTCTQQSVPAFKNNMNTLTEICTFHKGFEEFVSEESAKTSDELESGIKQLQVKLNAEK